ncbi:hypothetical protein HII00_000948 [Escherichia coli]|nr:hypothetical protein [Escherichia coli]
MRYRLASPTKSNPIRSRIIQCPPGFFRTSSESIHRLDLTHEYLHLAFDGYPTGLDENYIETLTRQLLMD